MDLVQLPPIYCYYHHICSFTPEVMNVHRFDNSRDCLRIFYTLMRLSYIFNSLKLASHTQQYFEFLIQFLLY